MVDELLDARHDVLALRDAKTAAVWVGGALRRKIALHVDHEQRIARRDRADGDRLRRHKSRHGGWPRPFQAP